jgi:ABC-type multidrug transport system ATPase subunit
MKENEDQIPLIDGVTDSNALLNINGSKHVCDEAVLIWSHVHVECRQHKTSRILLDDLSGIALPGQIVAIMGTSGVGKTTLLKVLSGQDDPRTMVTNSNVLFNGRMTTRSERLNGSIIGLVEQNELFVETMSLKEHLIFQVYFVSILILSYFSCILNRPC